jgi:hypothetical protein
VDDEFERFIKLRVGERNWAKLTSDELRRVMESQWELGIKRQFDVSKRLRWTVDVPGFGSYQFERYVPEVLLHQRLTQVSDHVEALFQPVCSKTRALIKQQVDQVLGTYKKLPKVC